MEADVGRMRVTVIVAVAVVEVPFVQAGATARPARGGELRFAPHQGAELPNKGALSEVVVECSAPAGVRSCSGAVQLLPRGRATRALVGGGPLASATVGSLARGRERDVLLSLSRVAREKLPGHVLQLTAVLSQAGRITFRRNFAAEAERPILGHSRPDRTVVKRIPGSGQNEVQEVFYSWNWDIPVRHYLVVPSFQCPSNAAHVAWNGTFKKFDGKNSVSRAKLDVTAKSGTGYGGFRVASVADSSYVRNAMTGWPTGDWSFNSVWAPAFFEDGHFELTATCTNVAYEIASADRKDLLPWMFPWVS
jgi:hypothetical protein